MSVPTIYSCAECGCDATVEDGVVVRTCDHDDSTVTASLSATAYGKSHFEAEATSSTRTAEELLAELFIGLLSLAVAEKIKEMGGKP